MPSGPAEQPRRVLIHADEACLGNGRDGATPGGAAGLVETRRQGAVVRRDYYLSEPDTTNNRMAIRSALEVLRLLRPGARPLQITFVSDSEYLIKGMSVWLPGWRRRDWKNVKNLDLWHALVDVAEPLDITWRWVRGHANHPKNEYADFLATRAAREGHGSDGLVDSAFAPWLAGQREKGRYLAWDPDDLNG